LGIRQDENFVDGTEVRFLRTVSNESLSVKKVELIKKIGAKRFEGKVYSQLFEFWKNIRQNKAAKPQVSKNSTGL